MGLPPAVYEAWRGCRPAVPHVRRLGYVSAACRVTVVMLHRGAHVNGGVDGYPECVVVETYRLLYALSSPVLQPSRPERDSFGSRRGKWGQTHACIQTYTYTMHTIAGTFTYQIF
jgi:hypothetical protein